MAEVVCMNITINVTKDDIIKGQKGKCFYCPVALATKRTLKCKNIMIRSEELVSSGFRAVLPLVVRQWIWDYDHGQFVEPLSFELELAAVEPIPESF